MVAFVLYFYGQSCPAGLKECVVFCANLPKLTQSKKTTERNLFPWWIGKSRLLWENKRYKKQNTPSLFKVYPGL